MIAFGLRLSLRGGRESVTRLVTMAAAVALGVGLLLATLAGISGVGTQNARYAWLNTGTGDSTVDAGGTGAEPAGDPLWWLVRADYYGGHLIGRVDVAATGPAAPVPPGIPRLPGPGEYYASPALRDLLASTPAAQLGNRFPGHLAGTIGAAALPAPDTLLIIVGNSARQLSTVPGATEVDRIETTTPAACKAGNCTVRAGISGNGIVLILGVAAGGLVVPILVFIGTAARLSAARREQRFAAMRLVGATPRQVALVATVESAVAAVIGVAAGFGLFYAVRDPLATVPFTGAPFFPGDLRLGLPVILLVGLGVPVAAAIVARLALRRVTVSPLGVSRRVTPKPPSPYRVIPLLLGLGELAAVLVHGRPPTANGQLAAYLPGFLLILVGLITAGPWLTMVGARLISHRTSRPAALLAARRLADNPRAAFRAVSGLVLALFVMTVAVAVIGGIVANQGGEDAIRGTAAHDTLLVRLGGGPDQVRPGSSIPPAVLDQVAAVPGVTGITAIHRFTGPQATDPQQPGVVRGPTGGPDGALFTGVASCDQLATMPVLGRCPAGASTVLVPFSGVGYNLTTSQSTVEWSVAPVTAEQLARLPVETVVVGATGSVAVERVRTILEAADPGQLELPVTVAEDALVGNVHGYTQLAEVVILASLPIAGCTLAVSVVAGLTDRRRPFALLRLAGAQLRVLRRVVMLESVVPLLVVSAVSVGAAFLAAELFVRSQMRFSLAPPGAGYYLAVTAGLAASLGILAATFPLLARVTGPETARNE